MEGIKNWKDIRGNLALQNKNNNNKKERIK